MNYRIILTICFSVGLLSFKNVTTKLPSPKKTLKVMELTNHYFMEKWPDIDFHNTRENV